MRSDRFSSAFPAPLSALLLLLLTLCASAAFAAPATSGTLLAHDATRGGGVLGPTVALDPGFDYYASQPWSETFRRIREAGFTAVQIIDTGTTSATPERMGRIAAECRAAGLAPVLRLFPPTDFALYEEHPEWRQRMLGGGDGRADWRVYLCLNQQPFVEAYCALVERKMREVPYDGIQFVELWLEQWGGPRDGDKVREHYACVCDECVRRFREISGGVDARDLLTSPTSPRFFRKKENEALYCQWVDFRVETVTRFGQAIAAAARRGNPRASLDLMLLSDVRVEPGKVREYQAIDMERLVGAMKPDSVTIQDAWQDWLQEDLQPGFVADYGRAYAARLRKVRPDLFIFSHADIGSRPVSKRSPEWIRSFAEETVRAGFSAPSFYEWSISRLAGKTE